MSSCRPRVFHTLSPNAFSSLSSKGITTTLGQSRTTSVPTKTKHRLSYVYDLYVKPSYTRQGVGRSLLRIRLGDLHPTRPHQIRLNVWTKSGSAIGLYRKTGFIDHLVAMKADADAIEP